MSLDAEVHAIRGAATLHDATDVRALRVTGAQAEAALQRICPRELALYEGQALHSLFLDEQAQPVADIYVCATEQGFLLLGEERLELDLRQYLREHGIEGPALEVRDLAEEYSLLCLNGPYVWELLAELLTPEIIGLSYLAHFQMDDIICLRAGKTGEYGYDLLVPHAALARTRQRLLELGTAFDLSVVSRAALDRCAFENWFFDIRQQGLQGLTPLELQLQWRVSYNRSFPGAARLAEKRRRGPTQRVVMVVSSSEPVPGASVEFQGAAVGRLLATAYSPIRKDWIGLALLDPSVAHPGLTFSSPAPGGALCLRAISPPALNNRSLYVDPQRHSYAARGRDVFPPLIEAP